MKKQLLLICIIAAITTGCSDINSLLNNLDEQYGDTIPQVTYKEDYIFNKKVYDNKVNSKLVSIYASYPNDIDKYILIEPTLNFIEQAIISNWKPYVKKDNEVIIALKINNDGSKEYKFLGNTGIYAAANAARTATLSPKLIGDNTITNADSVELVYKFTVSSN